MKQTKHQRIITMLDLLERHPLSLRDLAVMLNTTKDNIRTCLYDLEFYGAVNSTYKLTNHRGIAAKERVVHLVDKTKYQQPARKPYKKKNKCQPSVVSNYPTPAGGQIYRNLDKPERVRPLRKINTAWMGYQSGLELA